MDLGLTGKVAIVTGAAAGGLGDGIATRLVEEGCRVVAVDRDEEGLRALVERLGARRDTARARLRPVHDRLRRAAGGRCAGAVSGASTCWSTTPASTRRTPWDEYSVDEWDAHARHQPARDVARVEGRRPGDGERGGGSIVNIGSITALIGMANILPYIASKGGVIGLTRALAREVGPLNVRVNTVSPGAFPTGGERIHPDPRATAASCSTSRA